MKRIVKRVKLFMHECKKAKQEKNPDTWYNNAHEESFSVTGRIAVDGGALSDENHFEYTVAKTHANH